MFSFNPPAKIARTQRSNQVVHTDSSFVASISSTTLDTSRNIVNIADSHHLRPIAELSGIGATVSWIVYEGGQVAIFDHSVLSSLNRTRVGLTARHETVPEFQIATEGEPVFVSELAEQRTVAFCSRRGTVVSSDKFLQLSFCDSLSRSQLEITAFSCSSTSGRCVVAVGTAEGAVLVTNRSVASAQPVQSFSISTILGSLMNSPNGNGGAAGATTSCGGSTGWWSWLNKGRSAPQAIASTRDSTASSTNGNAEPAAFNAVSLIKLSQCDPRRLLVATERGHVLLLHMNEGDASGSTPLVLQWSLSPRDVACLGRDQSTTPISVVSIVDNADTVVLLVAVESAIRGTSVSSCLVTVAAASGVVLSCTAIGHKGLFPSPELPRPGAANLALDSSLQSQMVVILSRNLLLRVNNSVGVRSPCSVEDAKCYNSASDAIIAGSMLHDRRVVLLLPSRPLLVEGGGGASRPEDVLEHGTVSISQRLANIRQAFRSDSRHSVDEVCLAQVDDVLHVHAANDANWARADLENEDANLLTHVTQSVKRRRERLEQLVLHLLSERDIREALSDDCVTKMVSTVDQMIALEAVRNLQNYSPVIEDGGKASRSTGGARWQRRGDASSESAADVIEGEGDGDDALASCIDNTEGRQIQLLLKDAIRHVVADIRSRSATPINPNISATEIFYSKPAHVVQLLHSLNTHLITVFQGGEYIQEGERFNIAVAVAIVFHDIVVRLSQFWQQGSVCEVRHLLWSINAGNDEGGSALSPSVFAQQSLILADSLAVLASDTSPEMEKLPRRPRVQIQLLEALVALLHLQMRHVPHVNATERMHFGSSALRRTLFRPPFLSRPTGFPFGFPEPSVDNSFFKAALAHVEALAHTYNLFDVMFDFTLAEYHEEPAIDHFSKFFRAAENPEQVRDADGFVEYSVRQLCRQSREADLSVLYAKIPQKSDVRSLLDREFPHILRRLEPLRLDAIVREGLMSPSGTPYMAFADNALDHLSRCVALAKLAHAASGGVETSASILVQEQERLVAVQRSFLSPAFDKKILTRTEMVQELLALPKQKAWIAAVGIAEQLEDGPVRGELLTQILRHAFAREQTTLSLIRQENTSDVETKKRISETAVGRVLVASHTLNHQREFDAAVAAIGMHSDISKMLRDWLVSAHVPT